MTSYESDLQFIASSRAVVTPPFLFDFAVSTPFFYTPQKKLMIAVTLDWYFTMIAQPTELLQCLEAGPVLDSSSWRLSK